MCVTLNLRASKKCTAHASKKRVLRQAFATAIAFGVSMGYFNSQSIAQYNSGDLPASPWSNRADAGRSDASNPSSNLRLRQPTSSRPQGADAERANDRQFNQSPNPSPIKLLGPMLPLPSNPEGPIYFPHESRNKPKSDWNRLPAGGLVIDSEPLSPEFEIERPRDRLATLPTRRIGVGLPDRGNDPGRNGSGQSDEGGVSVPVLHVLPSQMASAKQSIDLNEPITLRSSSRNSIENSTNSQKEPLSVVTLSRTPHTTFPTEEPRQDVVVHRPIAGPSTLVHSVRETLPNESRVSTNQRTPAGQEGAALSDLPTNDIQVQRLARAQRVSHETLSSSAATSSRAPEALESLPGFDSVKRELKQCLEKCDSLLKRGAILSAREEAGQGLLRLYRTMDLYRGSLYSEPAYEKAMSAIREESDFQKILGGRQGSGVQDVVDTHSTEALKGRPLESTSPEMAAMHYRWYARYQLVIASDGHPWAADLLYAYGKTLEKDAELNPSRANMFRSQAVVFYQAAVQIAPTQSDAASQLGFALIHLDRMDDAYQALTASIQNKPNANAWNNLAEVFRRTGKVAEAEYAVQQATALSSAASSYTPDNPEITEVDPAVFARYSPMPTMAAPTQNFAPSNQPTTGPGRTEPSVRTAKSNTNFFSKLFAK
jgi:tetratricopeptide (TPR) repeat protein